MVLKKRRTYSLYKVLKHLLDLLNVEVTDKVLRQILDEQKTYNGSIRVIKEVLSDLEIESRIYRVDYYDLLDIECPILAHIEQDTPYFVVISECSEETISYFDSVKGYITESVPDFRIKWSGVILIPLTSQQSGDPEFKKNQQDEIRFKRLRIAFISAIIICLILLTTKTILFSYNLIFILAAFILCKIFGTIISALIVKIEFGNSDSIIRQICSNSECEKVLHSKGSKLFTWLSMGDIGIIYFSGGLFLLFTIHSDIYPILNILMLLNLITLPYTIYSVFYQLKIAKAFCPFCCTVILLLWVELLVGSYVGHNFSSIELSDILYSVNIYLITIVLWFLFKSFISKAFSSDSYKSVVSRIKKDVEIFNSTLNARLPVPELSVRNEITLGDINTQFTLIAIISPNCHSCNHLYTELKAYSLQFPDRLKIVLRFKGIDTEKSEMNKVIDWIITLHFLGESSMPLEIYESWNEMKLNGVRKWEEKNHLKDRSILPEAVQTRLTYTNWINSLDIPGVPAMIFNGKILPVYYNFNDIKYLIRRLYEKRDFQ